MLLLTSEVYIVFYVLAFAMEVLSYNFYYLVVHSLAEL